MGYTLEYPASGDWWFTNKFYELVGNKFAKHKHLGLTEAEIRAIAYDRSHNMNNYSIS